MVSKVLNIFKRLKLRRPKYASGGLIIPDGDASDRIPIILSHRCGPERIISARELQEWFDKKSDKE